MKTPFKKGQTVYWGELKGEVVEVYGVDDAYPVSVIFSCDAEAPYSFTNKGRYVMGLPPVLSITPYTLNGFSQEPQIEKDTLVYVRNRVGQDWEMMYYSHYENGKHFCFECQLKSANISSTREWLYVETENPLLK